MKYKIRIAIAAFFMAMVAIFAVASARELLPYERQLMVKTASAFLRDPSSAQFQWPEFTEQQAQREEYCFWINAKNGFGGYTGNSLALVRVHLMAGFMFQVATFDLAEDSSSYSDAVRGECYDATH